MREKFQKRLGVSDLFYPDRRIAALGARAGFAVLNLAPPLQRYAEEHQVFLHGFKNTPMGFGHWNEAGHAAAGHLIAQKLCAMITEGGLDTRRREAESNTSVERSAMSIGFRELRFEEQGVCDLRTASGASD
jgi:hypothetical protein